MQRGLLDPEKVDPFSLFVETGGITYCLYKDSERILGNTFGMCILQVYFLFTIYQPFIWPAILDHLRGDPGVLYSFYPIFLSLATF